jgi:serine O-acetyltransferase
MIEILLKLHQSRLFSKVAYYTLKILGVEIPTTVKIGKNLQLPHWAYGTVIHSKVIIGNNVKIYQGVTIGRADIYQNDQGIEFIKIEDNVILCSGSKLLVKKTCTIPEGLILGANSVLIVNESKIPSGVYVGLPAKKIK